MAASRGDLERRDKGHPGMKNKRARSVKQEVEEPDEDEHQCVFQATATQARFGVDFNITFKCEIGGDKCEFRRRVGEDLNCDSASLRFVDGPPSFLENLTNFSWKTSNQLWLKVPREYLNKIIHTLKKKPLGTARMSVQVALPHLDRRVHYFNASLRRQGAGRRPPSPSSAASDNDDDAVNDSKSDDGSNDGDAAEPDEGKEDGPAPHYPPFDENDMHPLTQRLQRLEGLVDSQTRQLQRHGQQLQDINHALLNAKLVIAFLIDKLPPEAQPAGFLDPVSSTASIAFHRDNHNMWAWSAGEEYGWSGGFQSSLSAYRNLLFSLSRDNNAIQLQRLGEQFSRLGHNETTTAAHINAPGPTPRDPFAQTSDGSGGGSSQQYVQPPATSDRPSSLGNFAVSPSFPASPHYSTSASIGQLFPQPVPPHSVAQESLAPNSEQTDAGSSPEYALQPASPGVYDALSSFTTLSPMSYPPSASISHERQQPVSSYSPLHDCAVDDDNDYSV